MMAFMDDFDVHSDVEDLLPRVHPRINTAIVSDDEEPMTDPDEHVTSASDEEPEEIGDLPPLLPHPHAVIDLTEVAITPPAQIRGAARQVANQRRRQRLTVRRRLPFTTQHMEVEDVTDVYVD